MKRIIGIVVFLACAPGVSPAADFKSHMQAGWDAFKAEDYESAILAYDKALKKARTEEDKAYAAKSIGVLYLRLGDRRRAAEYLEQAVSLEPENADYLYLSALLLGDPEERVRRLQKAVQLAPDHLLAWTDLGGWYAHPRFRKWEQAVEALEHAETLSSSPERKAGLSFRLAHALLNAGRPQEALKRFRKIVEDDPGSEFAPPAALEAGSFLNGGAKSPKGERLLRWACEALDRKPAGLPDFRIMEFAVECGMRGYVDLAARLYESLLAGNPRDPWMSTRSGWLHAVQGDSRTAEGFFLGALATAEPAELPVALHAYEGLMRIYKERGDRRSMDELLDRAKSAGARIRRRHAEDSESHEALAAVLAVHGSELDRAEKLARQGVALRSDVESRHTLGLVLMEKGRFKEAAAAFERAVSTGGSVGPVVYWSMGKAYRAAGHEDKAKRAWERGLRINPRHRLILAELGRGVPPPWKRAGPEAAVSEVKESSAPGRFLNRFDQAGWEALNAGDDRGAVENYEKALVEARNDRERAATAKNLGNLHYRMGDKAKAEDYLEKAARWNPLDADNQYRLFALYQDRPRAAVKILESLVRAIPDDFLGWYYLGSTYAHPFNDLDKAADALERALKIAAGSADRAPEEEAAKAAYSLGVVYRAAHRPEEALRLFKTVVQDHPFTAIAPAAAGSAAELLLESRESRPEGLALAGRACESLMTAPLSASISPQAMPVPFSGLAALCSSRGYYEIADGIYQQLVSANPADPGLLSQMGILQYIRGDMERSQEFFRKLPPESAVTARRWLARIYRETGAEQALRENLEEGAPIGEQLIRSAPDSALAHSTFAEFLAVSGARMEEAEQEARRAVELDPNAESQGVLGFVLLSREKYREAVEALEKSAEKGRGSSPLPHFHLGKAYRGLGEERKARQAFREGLEIDPQHRFILAELKGGPAKSASERGSAQADSSSSSSGAERPALRLAVLLLDNRSVDMDAPAIVRFWMHNRLSRRGFDILPLEETDKALKDGLGITDGGQLNAASPQRIGEVLGVQGAVYGVVEEFGMINLGFIRKRKVKVSFRFVDTKSGRERWRGEGEAVDAQAALTKDKAVENFVVGLAGEWSRNIRKSVFDREAMEAVRASIKTFPRGAY